MTAGKINYNIELKIALFVDTTYTYLTYYVTIIANLYWSNFLDIERSRRMYGIHSGFYDVFSYVSSSKNLKFGSHLQFICTLKISKN